MQGTPGGLPGAACGDAVRAPSGSPEATALSIGMEDFPRRSPSGASLDPCSGPSLACRWMTLGHIATKSSNHKQDYHSGGHKHGQPCARCRTQMLFNVLGG